MHKAEKKIHKHRLNGYIVVQKAPQYEIFCSAITLLFIKIFQATTLSTLHRRHEISSCQGFSQSTYHRVHEISSCLAREGNLSMPHFLGYIYEAEQKPAKACYILIDKSSKVHQNHMHNPNEGFWGNHGNLAKCIYTKPTMSNPRRVPSNHQQIL